MSADKELPVIGWLRAGWRADTGDSRPTAPMRISRSVEYSVPVADHARASARIAELEQQLEQARKDQARYRWLRECSPIRSDRTAVGVHWPLYENGRLLNDYRYPCGEQLDALIDTAIASRGTAQEVGK